MTQQEVSCVSLGMVIIDEIRMPNKPVLSDVIGGSATFVTLGQRLFADTPSKVGCLVLVGRDFPPIVEDEVRSWGTAQVVKKNKDRLSTRGLLEYEDDTFGPKKFTYTTEPIRATPMDLADTPLLHAKAFHFFGTPEEVLTQVPALLHLRRNQGINIRPLIVWEPLPVACAVTNRQPFLDACKLVDVFSPNHIELTMLFTDKSPTSFRSEELESYGQVIIDSRIGPDGEGTVIIRAGENGALSMSSCTRATWLPAYYDKDSPKIIDPTGAGNTFLGAYIAGWQKTGDNNEAMYYGQVAASFALEQIGLPKSENEGRQQLWNGATAMERLEEYKKRLSDAKVKSMRVL